MVQKVNYVYGKFPIDAIPTLAGLNRALVPCHSVTQFQHAPITLGTLIHEHLLSKVP